MSSETREETVPLNFYEVRGDSWQRSETIHTYLNESFEKAIVKAVKKLGIRADRVAVITPDGATVRVREGGRELTVKDVVDRYGFTFGITTEDVLG